MSDFCQFSYPWNKILCLLSAPLTNQKVVVSKAELLFIETSESQRGWMSWSDLIGGLMERNGCVLDGKLVIRPMFCTLPMTTRHCIFAFLLRCLRYIPARLLHQFSKNVIKLNDDNREYAEFLLTALRQNLQGSNGVDSLKYLEEFDVSEDKMQEENPEGVGGVNFLNHPENNSEDNVLKENLVDFCRDNRNRSNARVDSDSVERNQTNITLLACHSSVLRENDSIRIYPGKRFRREDEVDNESQQQVKLPKMMNNNLSKLQKFSVTDTKSLGINNTEIYTNTDHSTNNKDKVDENLVKITDNRQNSVNKSGILKQNSMENLRHENKFVESTEANQLGLNSDCLRLEELKANGCKIVDLWEAGIHDDALIRHCLVSLSAVELTIVLQAVNAEIVSEVVIVTGCQSAVFLHREISVQSITMLTQHIILSAIASLLKPVSRQLMTGLLEFCKTYPGAVIGSVFKPLMNSTHIGSHQVDVLVKIFKDVFSVRHQRAVLELIGLMEVEWVDNILLLIQTAFESQVELGHSEIESLLASLETNGCHHQSSLKFGKLLLSFIKSHSNKINREQLLRLQSIANEHSSFLKKSILATLSNVIAST